MDIFDFAMQMEKDGQAYYEKMAAQAENQVLKSILMNLAQDEVKHYNIFKKFKEGDMSGVDDMENSTMDTLSNAKNVFQKLSDEKPDISFPDDIVAAWKEAQEIEKKSEDFYRMKAEETDHSGMKKTILRIADEEHRHWVLIENVLQFLDRPKHWLEDAEWNHLDEY